jgi:hypothetical protein
MKRRGASYGSDVFGTPGKQPAIRSGRLSCPQTASNQRRLPGWLSTNEKGSMESCG